MIRSLSVISTAVFNILLFPTQQATSQSGGIHFGLYAGINFQNITGVDQFAYDLNNDILTAFSAGVNLEIPVFNKYIFQPSLLFAIKGAKSTEVISGITNHITRRISYLQLPLNLLYKPVLGNGHLILGLGPYLALGLGGNSKYIDSSSSHVAEIKFINIITATAPLHVDYFRPIDFGANMLVGYEFSNKLSFQLNAQLGFTKINPDDERIFNNKTSEKNIGFGISVGYGL